MDKKEEKETKTKKATTKKATPKKANESVKPTAMVSDIKDIRAKYGKSAIIIKGNLVFRTSTQTLEKGPLSLHDLYLPNYGKMRKFIVLEDGVYELTTKEIQSGTQFAQYEKHKKVNIDPKEIDFNIENAWNFKKVEKEAPKKVVKKEEDKPKLVEEVKLDKPKLHQFKIVEVVLFGLISLLFGIIIGQQSILMFSNNNSEEKIIAAYNEIKENFYKEVDDKGLINAAIKGMMDFLNEENSVFMNENETTAYNNDSAGEYDGYGLTVTQTEVGLTIIHVNDVIADKFSQINLPAVFTKINDKDITDYTLEDIVSYLKTTGDIKITFDDGKTVDLERQNIIMPTVKSEKMRDDLYYLKIGSFTNYTAKQIKEQVDALNSKNLIIDLRNNGGGLLDSLVDVSSIFSSKEQLIFKTKQKKDVTEYKTKGNGKDYNIVVLINEGSASAAEVLASFLSEQKDATLVGAKTFGKGTVQVLKELGNGSQIKYTVKEWITSKDKVVEKVGISPDIAEDDYDVQMDIALKEIYK